MHPVSSEALFSAAHRYSCMTEAWQPCNIQRLVVLIIHPRSLVTKEHPIYLGDFSLGDEESAGSPVSAFSTGHIHWELTIEDFHGASSVHHHSSGCHDGDTQSGKWSAHTKVYLTSSGTLSTLIFNEWLYIKLLHQALFIKVWFSPLTWKTFEDDLVDFCSHKQNRWHLDVDVWL